MRLGWVGCLTSNCQSYGVELVSNNPSGSSGQSLARVIKKSRGTRMRSSRRWLGSGDTARGGPYEGPATRRQRFLRLMTGQMQQPFGQVSVFVCWVPRMSWPSSDASTHHRRHSLLGLLRPTSCCRPLRLRATTLLGFRLFSPPD